MRLGSQVARGHQGPTNGQSYGESGQQGHNGHRQGSGGTTDPAVKAQVEHARAFYLSLDKLQVYANDDRTRTFVGLEASVGVKELQKLTYSVDKCLREYNLPSFYYPPSFHVSLGWCLGDMRAVIRQKLQKTELKLVDLLDGDDDLGRILVKNINCKSGNKIFEMKLKQ